MVNGKPIFLERPENSTIIVSAVYSIVCFFSLPFLLLFFSGGWYDSPRAISWFEIIFHCINLAFVARVFRDYLEYSLITFQLEPKKCLTVAAEAAGMMIGAALIWRVIAPFTGINELYMASWGTLPLTEMDLFLLAGDTVYVNPIFGTIVMVLAVPFINCCLFYAVAFTPAYNVRPWLGYVVVAAVIAFPRLCCGLTHWVSTEQLALYISQLPLHMIACWAYQRTDTVWTPIAAHVMANLAACLPILLECALQ